MEQVTAGAIIGRTFSIYLRNFTPILVIMFLVNLPSGLITWWSLSGLDRTDPMSWARHLQSGALLSAFVGLFAGALSSGAISYGVIQDLRDQPSSVGHWLSQGLAHVPRIVLISILSALILMVGFVLLIIPGLIAMAALAPAPVVGVIERLGGTEALRRAAQLTSGHRWSVFGALLVLGLIVGVPGQVVARMMVGNPSTLDATYQAILESSVVTALLGVVTSGLLATAPAVIYHALRTCDEGVDIETIARVFD